MTQILGHEAVLASLRQAAAQQRLAHAYLFAGPDGVGKRLVAGWFAQLLNCTAAEALRPCGQCVACEKTARRIHPDLFWLEAAEAPTVKIEQVRAIIERLGLRPYEGHQAVAIIHPAEALTEDAANALLKTLEEPRGEAVVILVTTDAGRCLPTLVSRCRLVRFGALAASLIARRLVETCAAPEAAARELARLAEGSLGRALALAQSGALARCRASVEQWRNTAILLDDRQALREALLHLIWWTREQLVRRAQGGDDPAPLGVLLEELLALDEAAERYVNPRLVTALVHTRLQASGVFNLLPVTQP
ncbi:MAG: DNA polymerase III subunit delta' [Candidatus Omnitrophica bacterium]|nr:DNA polymerase III subunit delta' [Candidatus Omnitrophota bacterium]